MTINNWLHNKTHTHINNHYEIHYCKVFSSITFEGLYLLRRTFHSVHCGQANKVLDLSLVRSQLLYCSPVWRPHLIKDIVSIENVQCRATKFILNDFSSDYKHRLVSLNLLPLMRSSAKMRMKHPLSRLNLTRHFYFNRLPRLWNSLPHSINDISQPISSVKSDIQAYFWDNFIANFNPGHSCTFHYSCPCSKCMSLPVSFNL